MKTRPKASFSKRIAQSFRKFGEKIGASFRRNSQSKNPKAEEKRIDDNKKNTDISQTKSIASSPQSLTISSQHSFSLSEHKEIKSPASPSTESYYREAKEIDLTTHPDPTQIDNKEEKGDTHLVYGDLHGNTLKLIHFLIRRGVIRLKPEDLYAELLYIYNNINNALPEKKLVDKKTGKRKKGLENKKSAEELLTRFAHILDKDIIYDTTKYLHFIGDELSDRGGCVDQRLGNDYLMLVLMDRLRKKTGNKISGTYSNHLDSYYNDYCKAIRTFEGNFGDGHRAFGKTTEHLGRLVREGLVSLDEVNELSESYLTTIKAIDYIYHEEEKKLTLLMHAPNGLEIIKAMAIVEYKLQTEDEWKKTKQSATALMALIDKINVLFQIDLRSGFLNHKLNGIKEEEQKASGAKQNEIHLRSIYAQSLGKKEPKPENPQMIDTKFTHLRLMNNRMTTNKNNDLEIPLSLEDGTILEFVNGHDNFHLPYGYNTYNGDIPSDLAPNMKCLDNNVGKYALKREIGDRADYTDMYFTQRGRCSPIPVYTPQQIKFYGLVKKLLGIYYCPTEIFLTKTQALMLKLVDIVYTFGHHFELEESTTVLDNLHKVFDYTPDFKFEDCEQNLRAFFNKYPVLRKSLDIENIIKEFKTEYQSRYHIDTYLTECKLDKAPKTRIENFIKQVREQKSNSVENTKRINDLGRNMARLYSVNRNSFEDKGNIQKNMEKVHSDLEKNGYTAIASVYIACFSEEQPKQEESDEDIEISVTLKAEPGVAETKPETQSSQVPHIPQPSKAEAYEGFGEGYQFEGDVDISELTPAFRSFR